ncbi:hypothetical protein Tco_0465085 [Tanacetum coccineum]
MYDSRSKAGSKLYCGTKKIDGSMFLEMDPGLKTKNSLRIQKSTVRKSNLYIFNTYDQNTSTKSNFKVFNCIPVVNNVDPASGEREETAALANVFSGGRTQISKGMKKVEEGSGFVNMWKKERERKKWFERGTRMRTRREREKYKDSGSG